MKKLLYNSLLVLLFLPASAFSQWEEVTDIPVYLNDTLFLDVFFLESNHDYGWVCGFQGTVLRTTDGGKSWDGMQIPKMDQLESITFVNDSVGYTSGIMRYGFGTDKIFKSTDGGVSWKDITPDWQKFVPYIDEFGLWGNFFLDEKHGMVVGGGCEQSNLVQFHQQFYKTTNGGNSWSVFKGSEENSGMSDVLLYPDGSGFAVSSGFVWIKDPDSDNWSVFSQSGDRDWQEEITHYQNTFLLPFSAGCTGNGASGGMRMSTDYGANWNEYRTGKRMFGAFLWDSLRGWAAGDYAAVYYTSDGGKSWELKNCGIPQNRHLDDIWFLDDTTGFVVGNGIFKYKRLMDTVVPDLTFYGDTVLCPGEEVVVSTDSGFTKFYWSNSDTTSSTIISKSGVYWVKAGTNPCDIGTSRKFTVTVLSRPEDMITIYPDGPICEGDTVELVADASNPEIEWSTGDKTQSIKVWESGVFVVSVIDTNGCNWRDTISVDFLPNPKPEVKNIGRQTVCIDDTTLLLATPGFSEYKWYFQDTVSYENNGDPAELEGKTNEQTVNRTGWYFVRTINEYGCENVSEKLHVNFVLDTNQIELRFTGNGIYFDSTVYPVRVCGPVEIYNKSWKEAVIDDITVKNNLAFSIPQSQFPITIPPFGKINLKVCFSPKDFGYQSDTLIVSDICWDHYIPVAGLGIPKDLEGTTRCGLQLLLKTVIDDNYVFTVAEPYPNPAENNFSVPFFRFLPNGRNVSIRASLINLMGNNSGEAEIGFDSETINDDGKIQQGNINFKNLNIERGFYFVLIRSGINMVRLPVIIQ